MARVAPLRIAIVEDNEAFRESLALLLGLRAGMEVVATVGNGNDVVDACLAHAPDVVVMDYRLPGRDGVQATAAVREACPQAAVVCLTASISATEARALFDAGAVACLSKDQELDEIVAAIRAAAGKAAGQDAA